MTTAALTASCVAEIPSGEGSAAEVSQAVVPFNFRCRVVPNGEFANGNVSAGEVENGCPVEAATVRYLITAQKQLPAGQNYRWRIRANNKTYNLPQFFDFSLQDELGIFVAASSDPGAGEESRCDKRTCALVVQENICAANGLFTFDVEAAIVVTGTGDEIASNLVRVQVLRPPCEIVSGGGGGTNPTCEIVAAEEICENFPPSPIIFDLGDRGYDLTNVDNGVKFDIDGDGALEQVSWTERGSEDAFLARDRNGNGEIDGADELFGNHTKLANGKTAAHGYIPLGELDLVANGGNGNRYVDSADRDFGTLMLWTDRDHDGRSSSAELIPLAARGVFAIALDADESDVVDEHGNHLAYVSPAYAKRNHRIERIRTTDVFFRARELKR